MRIHLLLLVLVGSMVLASCGQQRPAVEPGNLRWAWQAANPSEPVVANQLVFVATEAGGCATGTCPARIQALREDDGAPVWQLEEPRVSRMTALLVDGSQVYALLYSEPAALLAIDRDTGKLLWRVEGLAPAPLPVLSEQVVLAADLSVDGSRPLTRINRNTGERLPESELIGSLVALTRDSTSVYALVRDGRLAALDPASGLLRWQSQTRYGLDYHADQPAAVQLAISADSLILQARPAVQVLSEVEVFDATTGKSRWVAPLQVPDSEPVPYADGLIFLRDILTTELQAFDLRTGVVRWKQVVGRNPTQPVIGDGIILIGTSSNGVVALDRATGSPRWESVQVGNPGVVLADVVYGTRPTTGVGGLALTTAAYAYSATTGTMLWQVEDSGGAFGLAPVQAGRTVFLRTGTHLYALGG